jgi:hypothetical protein
LGAKCAPNETMVKGALPGGEPHAAHKRPHISFAPPFWAAPSTSVTAPVGVVQLPVSVIVRVTDTTQVNGLADVLSAILIWSNCAISPVVPAVRTLKLQVSGIAGLRVHLDSQHVGCRIGECTCGFEIGTLPRTPSLDINITARLFFVRLHP